MIIWWIDGICVCMLCVRLWWLKLLCMVEVMNVFVLVLVVRCVILLMWCVGRVYIGIRLVWNRVYMMLMNVGLLLSCISMWLFGCRFSVRRLVLMCFVFCYSCV